MAARDHGQRRKTNLRDIPSSFVGRRADLTAIRERLEGSRLVTITGPGGMGKTRVAIRAGEASLAAYSAHGGGGVWFFDCTDAENSSTVCATVASALGVRLSSTAERSAINQLGGAVARRGRILLVIDNFEHLVADAEATIGRWLHLAADARFLVTSRVALDLAGEALWPLPPLTGEDAVDLFKARAGQVRPDAGTGADETAVIREIVELLEGVPLALELAASRMAVVSAKQLRERLGRPLDVLERHRDVGRHVSMRRTVLDSLSLLPERARDAFVACGIFRDGFPLEAAEAVLGDRDVLRSLETLVRHSLLRARAANERGGEMRFSFFETIREVAATLHAAHPDRELFAERHAAFFAKLAGRLGREAALHGSGPAFVRLGREVGNVLLAHAHETNGQPSRDAADRALTTAVGLDPVLSARGLSRLRLRLLDDAIGHAGAASDRAALALAMLARGLTRVELGEMDSARSDFVSARALGVEIDAPGLEAVAETQIGELVEISGSTTDAHARFRRALTLLSRSAENPTRTLREADVYLRIGHAHRREGGLEEAGRAIDEAIQRYRQLGRDEGLAAALYEAAVVRMFEGERDAALAQFDEGLEAAARADVRATAGALTTARAGLLQEMGRLDEALEHHAEAARLFRELGSRYREASALYYVATAYLERGDAPAALRILPQALALARGVGAPRYEALIEGCRAVALASLGDAPRASESLAAAERAASACETERALHATVRIHRLNLTSRGKRDLARETEAQARELAAAHPSDDSRFALRMLLSVERPTSDGARGSVVVGGGSHLFWAHGSREAVDLSRRPSLARILDLLTQRRLDAPGDVVTLDALVTAGWPGERMGATSALNRARVALATLRKLGLRGILTTCPGGYRLDPSAKVCRAGDDTVPSAPS